MSIFLLLSYLQGLVTGGTFFVCLIYFYLSQYPFNVKKQKKTCPLGLAWLSLTWKSLARRPSPPQEWWKNERRERCWRLRWEKLCSVGRCVRYSPCGDRENINVVVIEGASIFFTFKGYWLRENKNTLKQKSRLSPNPVKKTVGEEKQRVEIQLTLKVSWHSSLERV